MLHPFKQFRLDKEPADIRRLMWICEMKKSMFPLSRDRRWFNIKRDKQILIVKNSGVSLSEIFEKSIDYECFWELANN